MEAPTMPADSDDAPEVGGNWFILFGAAPALLALAAAAWIALSPGPGPAPPPPPPPPTAR